MASLSSSSSSTIAFSLLILLFVTNATSATALSPNFYSSSCRLALTKIKTAVSIAVFNDRRMGASLLRLHFHDCFVNGCDGSLLLDDTPSFKGEKTAAPNFNSVRGYELIDFIKLQLESECPGVVSCADIVAVAARDSVVALGGPSWNVQLGRKDSITANLTAANSDLPSPSSDLNSLISAFARKGFTAKEMVALSGAHTIGKARCQFFRSNDANINSVYASWVSANCFGNNNRLMPFDGSTNTFDNTYFKDLKNFKGYLHSDQELYKGGRGPPADVLVNTYSTNTTAFFSDFANAMLKMGNLSPVPGSTGPVRTSCRKIKRF